MLDDIKKILEISKKGIVIMEDGKPAYIVMSFSDFIENTKISNITSNAEKGDYLFEKEKEDISSERIPEIDNFLRNNLNLGFKGSEGEKRNSSDIDASFDVERGLKNLSNQRKDMKEISLEDLPF